MKEVKVESLTYKDYLRKQFESNNSTTEHLVEKFSGETILDIGSVCCICLEDFEAADQVVQLPCNQLHIFHVECLKSWVYKNENCPMCREPIHGLEPIEK